VKTIFLIFAAVLMIISAYPYIRDILRGKTKPNIVSWITWTLLSGIATAAAITAGEYAAASFTAAVAVETILIVILGVRRGYVKYGSFEIICQVGAVIGIILWQVFDSPAVGVVATVVVDLIGALPTVVHSWRKPGEETASTYVLAAIAGCFAVAALPDYNWVSLPYTLYILVIDVVFAAIIIGRRTGIRDRTKDGMLAT